MKGLKAYATPAFQKTGDGDIEETHGKLTGENKTLQSFMINRGLQLPV